MLSKATQPRTRDLAECLGSIPAWVRALVEGGRESRTPHGRVLDAGHALLATLSVPDAGFLDPAGFERAAERLYAEIGSLLGAREARHLARVWNFIPGIHVSCGCSPDIGTVSRYMVFNRGRHRGFVERFFSAEAFPDRMPTATGVGHTGTDLVIHALALREAGTPVENPRQVPAYAYSRRWGDLPPCFARATSIATGRGTRLLVGGTASVRGEESVHQGDLARQLDETCENLRSLVRAWNPGASLEQVREARVYHPRAGDAARIGERVEQALANAVVEVVRADLCRPELLVEIECVVEHEETAP